MGQKESVLNCYSCGTFTMPCLESSFHSPVNEHGQAHPHFGANTQTVNQNIRNYMSGALYVKHSHFSQAPARVLANIITP